MKDSLGLAFNLGAVLLLALAAILHTVCLSVPHHVEANMDSFGEELKAIAARDPSFDPETGGTLVTTGGINYGMWKCCFTSPQINMCVPWADNVEFGSGGLVKTLPIGGWIYGVRAMAVIGCILLWLASVASLVNVLVKSKGDRLRLLYLAICVCCIIAAVIVLIGDIIMAAKYRDAYEKMMTMNDTPPPPEVYSTFQSHFALSWAFALDIVSVCLALLAAVCQFMAGRVALNLIV